jgi:AcrR family transcriptional regulator
VNRTRDRIVEAAVRLWNRSGVGPITTNHIAAELAMSPGNLYYHFKNKEEIVRAAFERMNEKAADVWKVDPALGPLGLHRMLTGNLALYAKYLFFARELPALLRADPVLRQKYKEVHAQRMDQISATLAPLVALGLIKNAGAEDLEVLVESAWVLGLFALPNSELTRQAPIKEDILRAARMVMHLFKPYMDTIAYEALVVIAEAELSTVASRAPTRRAK